MNFPTPATHASPYAGAPHPPNGLPSHGPPAGSNQLYPYSQSHYPTYQNSPVPPQNAPTDFQSHSHTQSLPYSSQPSTYTPPSFHREQTQIDLLITDPTLINSFFVTQQGLALYKSETKSGFWGDKKTIVYKLDSANTGPTSSRPPASSYPGGFPFVKMAEVETHSFSDNVVKVWERDVKPVKLTTWNESVEFPGLDGHAYKWKYNKDGFKLERRDTSDHKTLGSLSIEAGTIRIERDAMHLLDQCIATLVLGAKNRKETKEAITAAAEAVSGAA
ncbi:hypothetical protein K435DRAFT_876408 [Dendrothele bispora CBS 962.96]|uniref:DUF6593 domain-containing protein n=1 Tax=Dendrothele bispora (strain CBS 962.96) TaxID=1314807 RepID=A0A4S8KSG2_DENBC|nr:hypothetical protein K435DRAFT_876408 [Dendrothele bispora CBS 962.96]